MAWGKINLTGGASGGLPQFTYTGTYKLLDDGDKNWRIKFLTSGMFTPVKAMTIDVCCVGGGGSGAMGDAYAGCGGGAGGYTETEHSIVLQENVAYSIVIGAGGAAMSSLGRANTGGTTSAFNVSANGGLGGYSKNSEATQGYGGDGGSGGACYNGTGGSDGGNGSGSSSNGGRGQGTTTREFGEPSGNLYAGGGGSMSGAGGAGGGGGYLSASWIYDGVANTGGGGAASRSSNKGAGGSGIVIIRNHRAA